MLSRRGRLVLYYLFGLLFLILLYTLLYRHFMWVYEGRERGFFQALQVVVESMTTTGYGEDAPWRSPQLNLLAIAMQVSGLVALFMLLPLFVLPWLEERFRERLVMATRAPRGLRAHVIICGWSPLAEALARELALARQPLLIMDRDAELVTELQRRYPAIWGDGGHIEDLRRAGAARARALVANESDERNAAIALAAGAFPELRVLSVVSDPRNEPYLRYAGAQVTVLPRETMGLALAGKALLPASFQMGELTRISPDLEIAELPIQPGSSLVGRTLGEAKVGSRTGARVIGAWARGEYLPAPGPELPLEEGTVLVAAGTREQLERLRELTLSRRQVPFRPGHVVVAGCGVVGRRVKGLLVERGLEVIAVDKEGKPGVDVVGDALEERTLREARLEEASTLIVALDEDVQAIFLILIAHRLNPELQVIARANEEEMVSRMYRAGASYVLSLATVGARALSAHLLGKEVIALGKGVRLERVAVPPGLAGRTIGEARIRTATGCTVLAVERGRDGHPETEIGPEFRLEEGDLLILSGSDEHLQRFHQRFRSRGKGG